MSTALVSVSGASWTKVFEAATGKTCIIQADSDSVIYQVEIADPAADTFGIGMQQGVPQQIVVPSGADVWAKVDGPSGSGANVVVVDLG